MCWKFACALHRHLPLYWPAPLDTSTSSAHHSFSAWLSWHHNQAMYLFIWVPTCVSLDSIHYLSSLLLAHFTSVWTCWTVQIWALSSGTVPHGTSLSVHNHILVCFASIPIRLASLSGHAFASWGSFRPLFSFNSFPLDALKMGN